MLQTASPSGKVLAIQGGGARGGFALGGLTAHKLASTTNTERAFLNGLFNAGRAAAGICLDP